MQQQQTIQLSLKEAKEGFLKICNLVVPGFKVDNENKEAVRLFFEYAFRLPEFEESGLSLNKGILLIGPYGTGKTELFKILQKFFLITKSQLAFQDKVMWKIAEEFTKEGFKATESFSGHFFFDEMGLDGRENVGNFANKVNISDSIVLSRYNQFKEAQLLSHFTSNKTLKELKEYLDGRSFDRLLEMCNVIALTGDSRRKAAIPKAVIKPIEVKAEVEAPTINILEFLQKHIEEGKSIDVLPITEVYRLMVVQGHLKQPLTKEFEEMYQGKKTEAFHEYQQMIQKTVFPEKQVWMKKQEDLNKVDSLDITRRVHKALILKALKK